MITFILSILTLLLGYFFYSRIIERIQGVDPNRETPAFSLKDGVDYMPMPWWRIFLIQFLNIAGLGPIFGAVAGAMWGPIAFLWIALGTVFAGAVHDYFSGMLSLRHKGASIPEIVGMYLGKEALIVLRIFTVVLLIFVGVAFVSGPAELLNKLTDGGLIYWIYSIFAYYLLATLLPINKIIGKIYPVFGLFLMIMALGIACAIVYYSFIGELELQELTFNSIQNYHFEGHKNVLFPMMFVVISCGAISGFHSTQAPLMARCVRKETDGRRVFYGAMIAEGIVAIIWATAAMNFYGGVNGLNETFYMQGHGPAVVVDAICNTWFGSVGAVIAIVGVVVCPISTGDTAFRSARLIIADAFKLSQSTMRKRLMVGIPLFLFGYVLSQLNFSVIWKYLGLSNQILSMIMLWTISGYLKSCGKFHWIVSIPAAFMTSVCISYFVVAPNSAGGLEMNSIYGNSIGVFVGLLSLVFFQMFYKKRVLM